MVRASAQFSFGTLTILVCLLCVCHLVHSKERLLSCEGEVITVSASSDENHKKTIPNTRSYREFYVSKTTKRSYRESCRRRINKKGDFDCYFVGKEWVLTPRSSYPDVGHGFDVYDRRRRLSQTCYGGLY